MRVRRWDELAPSRKVLVMLAVSAEVSLAVSAWTDLAQRPAVEVRGPKRTWALAIAVAFVGPLLYFLRGRRPRPV